MAVAICFLKKPLQLGLLGHDSGRKRDDLTGWKCPTAAGNNRTRVAKRSTDFVMEGRIEGSRNPKITQLSLIDLEIDVLPCPQGDWIRFSPVFE